MDEKNGEVFDHHADLFSQIGNVSENETLRDFMLNSCGMIEPTSSAKNVSVPITGSGSSSQGNLWTHGYAANESAPLLVNHSRNLYNLPSTVPSADVPASNPGNTGTMMDTLVKTLPPSEAVLSQYSMPLSNKNMSTDCRSTLLESANHMPNPLFSGLHRISTDKVTQDFLDNLSKLDSNDMLKCNDYESLSWNGVICDSLSNLNFQSQSRLIHCPQSSVDKNGNSALFNSSHVEKISCGTNLSEHLQQNNFLSRLSPSASVETSVRTPATSYESASPLSSNRTPIRSDESISPMGSGHTPMRIDESTSPLTSIKTPVRMDEGSPMGRTPLRMDESFSPANSGSNLTARIDTSPSHKPNGQTSQSFENYSSPPSIFKKTEARSPVSSVIPSPLKVEAVENDNKKKEFEECDHILLSKVSFCDVTSVKLEREKCFVQSKETDKEILAGSLSVESSISEEPSLEISSKRQIGEKIPIPFVSAKRIDDTLVNKKSIKRTLPRTSDSEFYMGSSSSSRISESESETLVTNEVCGIKTEIEVPDSEKDKAHNDVRRLSKSEAITNRNEEYFNKSKRRRKKSDNLCLPSVKRRSRKRVTIYQSSMSPEETGIKLKIKLASSFQRVKPQKKRRARKQYGSDDEEDEEEEDEDEENTGSKRSKKCVRFSSNVKEPETSVQTEWGSKIPPQVLQKIFQIIVEEQGCVPSLVRLSSVCKLWNTVANRSELWQNIDLSSPYIKQKCKIDRYFRWLLENRLENIRDLNLSGWKFSNITMVLSLIGTHCTEIESIGLAGWQGLHYEHLKSLLQDCPRLGKLDLSDVSPESKSANSAVSQKSITYLTQTMGERLTQLILAHNTLTCLPQIISSLASHCPNLQILDLSNIRRVSHTEFALNIEHLQEGCQKLKVLRITNSCITLANVPLEKQVASPGFANLEELSIAGHQGTESLRITSVMDDTCLERILKTSHKLKLLDVRGCTRITDSSLVRVPAWDIQHLFLSGCYVTRQCGSGLELIAQKWSHSLVEIDLAWTTVTEDLNAAIMAFAEKGSESPLRVMNLCGSSVTLEPVKALLSKCRNLESLNLQSCRGLPRGVKRLYENEQLIELRNMLEKKDRDSVSEGEEKRDAECDGRSKKSPLYSTNNKNDDFDS